ncbi:MAG: fused MFS/spermidine synthase, partial [Pirellulales bacterium]|nr:fused MFS/spermidine synthase [Pirellulales bacterium]
LIDSATVPAGSAARVSTRSFVLVAACFLVSGFAALLYETVWLRQFAILLGTSEQALTVVLASYMAGLAIGALVASKVVDRIGRPLLTYGLLELGIAVTALAVPAGLAAAGALQISVLGTADELPSAGSPLQMAFCLATAFALILIPTGLMGATLPLLARHVVSRDQDLGPKVGLLYAINTGGAVLGTMTAAFWFLPALGLGRTTWIGVAANLLVFCLVLLLVRGRADAQRQATTKRDRAELSDSRQASRNNRNNRNNRNKKHRATGKQRQQKTQPGHSGSDSPLAEDAGWDAAYRYRWIVLFAAISGGISFCYEIVFTRMLGHLLGGSVFAFATMLSGFLLGIALGGALASRLATRRQTSAVGFVYAQAAAAVATVAAFQLVNRMMSWNWQAWGGASATWVQVVASVMVLLPTATCIGATFPLAIRIYAKDETEAASGSARVYFWNVLGGIIGAIATGTIVLPTLQYHGTTALAVLGNAMLAVAVLACMQVRPVHGLAPVLAIAVLALGFPRPPDHVMRASALGGLPATGQVLYHHVGRSATVTVFDDLGRIRFQTNGLPESTITPMGSGSLHRNSGIWLSALPPLVRPGCDSMLIIGLGGGVAAEAVPPSVGAVDVVELEPAVVEANRLIANLRDRDPFADPRVNVVINDGRNALALTAKKYDAIVSQPSHPWTAGASHLYTREFAALVQQRLNPGGIFLQWIHTEFVDAELTRSMGATLLDVFDHVRLYEPFPGTFLFVASGIPIRPEANAIVSRSAARCQLAPEDRDYFQRLGIVTPTHLFAMLRLDQAGLESMCADAELITDERNLLAMQAPNLLRGHDETEVRRFIERFSPLRRGLDTAEEICPSLDLPVYAKQVLARYSAEEVRQSVLPLVRAPDQRAEIEASLVRVSESSQAWCAYLDDAAKKYPENDQLVFLALCNTARGKPSNLGPDQQQRLSESLSPVQRMVIELIAELAANRYQPARQKDAELASISVDDAAYEFAVRLRLPWRLEAVGPERVSRAIEAVEIIDRSAPFANEHGLSWFRAAAALNAGRPAVALGTINRLANVVSEALDGTTGTVDPAALANLARCRELMRDPAPFGGGGRYQTILRTVEAVLERAGTY